VRPTGTQPFVVTDPDGQPAARPVSGSVRNSQRPVKIEDTAAPTAARVNGHSADRCPSTRAHSARPGGRPGNSSGLSPQDPVGVASRGRTGEIARRRQVAVHAKPVVKVFRSAHGPSVATPHQFIFTLWGGQR